MISSKHSQQDIIMYFISEFFLFVLELLVSGLSNVNSKLKCKRNKPILIALDEFGPMKDPPSWVDRKIEPISLVENESKEPKRESP
jgi:hypothetical protein